MSSLTKIPFEPYKEPIIERILGVHAKNIKKDLVTKKTRSKYMNEFEEKKNKENELRQKKNQEIMEKVFEQHKKLRQTIRRKDEHYQKTLKKSQIQEEQIFENKVKQIQMRREKYGRKSELHQVHQKPTYEETASTTLMAKEFFEKAHRKQMNWSLRALEKNLMKQTSAQKNRSKIEENVLKLRSINSEKAMHKLKAESLEQQRYKFNIKNSINKIEAFRNRSAEKEGQQQSQKKRRQEEEQKHMEKVRKMRENLMADIHEKFKKIEAEAEEKSQKFCSSKFEQREGSLERKRRLRQQKEAHTLMNFHQNRKKHSNKMDSLYKKDREKWGFVTSISAFKDVLIQKNIYESNQLTLQN